MPTAAGSHDFVLHQYAGQVLVRRPAAVAYPAIPTVVITVDKTNLAPGERITATLPNVPALDGDWVGLFKAGPWRLTRTRRETTPTFHVLQRPLV